MPRLRVAAPQVTGNTWPSVTPSFSARADGLVVGDLLALEVALHERLGDLGHLVHQLLAVLLGLRAKVLGDLDLLAVPSRLAPS